MLNSDQGNEIIDFMNIVEKLDPGEDMKAGEGSVNRDIKKAAREQQYTRDEIVKMADYIKRFVSNNSQDKSWKYGDDLITKIGADMSSFINQVQTNMAKDPAVSGVTDGKDMMDKDYCPNSYQKASKTKDNDYNN